MLLTEPGSIHSGAALAAPRRLAEDAAPAAGAGQIVVAERAAGAGQSAGSERAAEADVGRVGSEEFWAGLAAGSRRTPGKKRETRHWDQLVGAAMGTAAEAAMRKFEDESESGLLASLRASQAAGWPEVVQRRQVEEQAAEDGAAAGTRLGLELRA